MKIYTVAMVVVNGIAYRVSFLHDGTESHREVMTEGSDPRSVE